MVHGELRQKSLGIQDKVVSAWSVNFKYSVWSRRTLHANFFSPRSHRILQVFVYFSSAVITSSQSYYTFISF